ncbi:TIGR01459 family HAD-type hydrolase [Chelatococcus sp. SYSU_G07232]|uniref:TIGR01459 family HAD-type hydrolase n=1 Tax=Chelatococcus albus TaxID=3047466 RepID=A0ABT7AET8_9HYPH|nr:TIGR01459 family HAD-type hydrolase [Chelatococcus sp. SYSU_G07232]MDJ1157888.1 TIGR01459 family HAD-type hydrolase [Chelatococcus sp. SYSU_G07232]
MTGQPAPVPAIAGLSAMAGEHDLLLCDVWGVLHDGTRAFPEAGEALSRFRQRGGTTLLVSNAPRPNGEVIDMLDRLGVPRSAYDAVVTSGDVTRTEVAARAGKPVHHLGPPRDLPIFTGLDAPLVAPDVATYVVCTGLLDDDTETPEDYRETLAVMLAHDLPMICANPDLVVERGSKLVYCAGALAELYEAMGGRVSYAGKPHRPIYEAALRRAAEIRGAPVDHGRILCIGDAIRTDVAGAAVMGLPALLVARGIHAAEFSGSDGNIARDVLAAWLGTQTPRPAAVIDSLVW